MNGVWAARHGTFGPRIRTAAADAEAAREPATEPGPDDDDAGEPADMEQNAGHG
jgi:hypothetical protein